MGLKFSGLLIFNKGNLFKNLKLLLFENKLQHCVKILLTLSTKSRVFCSINVSALCLASVLICFTSMKAG